VIHPATRIGAVHLTVRDLDRTVAFYEQSLGFTVERDDRERATLGAGGGTLLTLVNNPAARASRGGVGLFHLAVLVPSRAALASVLRQLLRSRVPLHGASDHGVSEALYLADPEGNGIEVYRDRPRDAWPRRDGGLAMGTARLDLESLMDEPDATESAGLPRETVIGHVHLRVSEIAPAEAFYCDQLGFSLMQRYGASATFVSAGGYHHHIAFNTWESRGAPAAARDAAGLRWFEVLLPDQAARSDVIARLERAGVAIDEAGDGLLIHDPSGNAVLLGLGGSSSRGVPRGA